MTLGSPRTPPLEGALRAARGRLALTAAALLAACGGGAPSPEAAGAGTLRLALTDAPGCGYEHVTVTVERVRFHRDTSAEADSPGWAEIVLQPARRIDLLSLANGVLEELGQTPLPAGRYTQGRLVLADNTRSGSWANALRPSGGSDTALHTPSGQTSGLKFAAAFDVAPGQVADVVLDFDACRSVIRRGHSGRYNLKPVLTVIPRLGDAGQRVVGHVAPALATPQTQVSVQLDGRPVKSTWPDPNGRFVLYPVPVGRYDLVLTAPGHALATVTGVPVGRDAITTVGDSAAPLSPPTSTWRTVTGTVQPAAAAEVADMRVLRRYADGMTVEVAGGPVDGDTGSFAYALPAAPPVRAAYGSEGTSLAWTADTTVPAAGYRFIAHLDTASQAQDVDLGAPVLPPLLFVFP